MHRRRKPASLGCQDKTLAMEKPAGCTFDQIRDLEEHFDLHESRNFVVERLDFSPQISQLEYFPHDYEGLRDL